ncbi:phosphatase PAP2 family protein [Sulfurimonas aquatica]|uniref:Phosphatase PAP2 family protein n=2 Tax=Sulfurimonas aquatica TaxID=2672570 RepID=A0A975B2L4_9BACT|nr:phosphatase PAP2 family protein [Sulfurimonas aquatica]
MKIINKLFKITTLLTLLYTLQLNAQDRDLERAGDIVMLLLPASSYAYTHYQDDKDGRIEYYKSFATNAVVTYGLKYSVDAQRPDRSDNHSFPSAHTSLSFQSAAFLHKRYGLEKAILSYIGATFVGYTRVVSEKHYIGDVIAGAVIGSLSSYFFTSKYENIEYSLDLTSNKRKMVISYVW